MLDVLRHPSVNRLTLGTLGSAWEGKLYLVGGCVREALLGRAGVTDFDVVLSEDAVECVEWLFRHGIADTPPVTYPRFGTAMVMIDRIPFEFATARRESYDSVSRKPSVAPASLLDDMKRRDFTCNALTLNIHTSEVEDRLGSGLADLRAGILRTPLDPEQTFFDDPLRMLRAVRFAAQLGFDYAPGLRDSIREIAPRLAIISEERIRDEWSKMLVGPDPTKAMQDLLDLGLLAQFAPEFTEMVGVSQGKWHFLDVWDHTLLVLKNAQTKSLDLALGCLLHDVAKPTTRTVDTNGDIRFFGHEGQGADMSRAILRRLKFPGETVDNVAVLVKNHMRLAQGAQLSNSAIRRLVRDLGPNLSPLLELVEADASALKPGVKKIDLGPLRKRVDEVADATPAEVLRSPINGDEVMRLLDIQPGPEVGRMLHALTELVLEGELAPDDQDGARRYVVQHFSD